MDTRSPRSIYLPIVSRLIALLLFVGLLFPFPLFPFPCPTAQAAIAQPDRVPLTLEILQDRLKNLGQSDGQPTVDLHGLIIDLSSENVDFRDQFYRLIKAQIQRPGTPVGLDLSNSVIQGNFQVSQLGLRAPLYGQALAPIFSPTEQIQLQRDRRRLSQLGKLSKSLLTTPNLDPQATSLQITAFRGALKLMQARFMGNADFTNTFFLNRVEAQAHSFCKPLTGI